MKMSIKHVRLKIFNNLFLVFQRLMKECMVRLIYCEMLGYESSFGYIHAIKLAQQGNLLEKRVGMCMEL